MRRLVILLVLLAPGTAFANATPRIVGGAKTSISQHPFQVALLSTDTSAAPASNEYQHQFCGGSILDATHVVTAAHCVFDSLVAGQAARPDSLEVLPQAWAEPGVAASAAGDRYQFERLGYFCVDPDSSSSKLVFNRTATLKDTWAKIAKD